MNHSEVVPVAESRANVLMLHGQLSSGKYWNSVEYWRLSWLGHGESGSTFEIKTRFLQQPLRDAISKGRFTNHQSIAPSSIEFFYPDGTLPCRIPDTDSPLDLEDQEDAISLKQYSQWLLGGDSANCQWTWAYDDYATKNSTGSEETIRYILGILDKHGPFIGVIGFSMGAALTAMIASLLEKDRRIRSPELRVSIA